MTDLSTGAVGNIGNYDLKWENSQLVLELNAAYGASSAGVVFKADAKQFMDLLIAKAPAGFIRDALTVAEAAALGK